MIQIAFVFGDLILVPRIVIIWKQIPELMTMSWGYRTFVTIECGALSLGALAAETTAVTPLKPDTAREQGAEIVKVKAHWGLDGKTTDEGPIIIGFSAGLTGQEITDSIRSDPTSFTDASEFSDSRRRLYPWAVINYGATSKSGEGTLHSALEWLKDFPKWDIIEGSALSFWAHNCASQALTTGAKVYYEARITQRWLKD